MGSDTPIQMMHAPACPQRMDPVLLCTCDALKQPLLIRTFSTGATRDTDEGKLDYEGFIAPEVWQRFAEYMHVHRIQSDGNLRASDNWQKGIPQEELMKSACRHFMDWWLTHRGDSHSPQQLEDTLCALLFNIQAYLLALLHDQH